MNNTINNENTSDLSRNNNININTYNNIDYHKLSIMHFNIRSFNHNVESLIVFIEQLNNIDMIAITETWLGKYDYPNLYFNNYECFKQNRIKINKKRWWGTFIHKKTIISNKLDIEINNGQLIYKRTLNKKN